MLEQVAAVVLGCGERSSQVGGRGQESRVAAAYGGPYGEERDGCRWDPVSGLGELGFVGVELADHDPDGAVDVLQDPVRPGQQVAMPGAGNVAHHDDVLAPQAAVRPGQQRPQPLRRLDTGVEQLRLHRLGVALGPVDGPRHHALASGGLQVGAEGGHRLRVRVDVHGRRLRRAGFDKAQRPDGGPGRWRGASGVHRRRVSGCSGVRSSPSPPTGPQSHSATRVPVER